MPGWMNQKLESRFLGGAHSVPLLMSMSEAFSVPFFYFNKTLLHKSS